MKNLALVVVAAMVSSCVTQSEIMQKRIASIPEDQRSYVIGTYAVGCLPAGNDCGQGFNSISLDYAAKAGKDWGVLSSTVGDLFGHNTVYDFTLPEKQEKGYYFCVGLPAGTWSFSTFSFYNFAGGGSGYNLRDENKFDLPFTLNPGEVVYVGKLKISTLVGKNFFGMKVQAPGVLYLSSNPEREIALALNKCPESVRARPVRSSPLSASMATGNPVVIDEPQSAGKSALP